jgi:hypothetical protein
MTDDSEWLAARIEAVEKSIVATEAAIDTVAAGGQTYSMDSGQTRLSVTRSTMGELKNALSSLENRRATLKARLCGGSVYGRPEF